jgi:curli biogenesis system outer membrane secretion channel CsgG
MRKTACLLALIAVGLPAFGQQSPNRPKVAILDFDYATVTNWVNQIFGSNQDVGKGISALLVTQLVKDGTYRVIERNALDKILTEQNFSNSDRADPNTAAKLGKILGVNTIIIGSITQFGRDDKHQGVGAFGNSLGRYGLGNVGHHEAKAVVGISARMISTDTAEILAVADGKGESKRSSTNLLGGGGNWGGSGGGSLDMGSSNFGQTILGEAVAAAVRDVAVQLEQQVTKVPTTAVHLAGSVADVSGNTLIVNVGSKQGLQVGDKLQVKHFVREVKDPATGKVLKRIENPVGELTITEVDADSATGTFAGSAVKVGDSVEGGH